MRREYKVRVWRCIAFVGLFLCFLLGLGVGAYAQNANDILGKAAAAYENSNGISASFTMFTASSSAPWGCPQLPMPRSTSTTTTAGRTAKVAVESHHVLGIARVAFAEIAVITVCHGVFIHPKCVLLLLRSFYRKSCPINISFSISRHLILPGFPDTHQCP